MPQSGQAFGREFCWGLLNTQKWQQVQEVSWTENSWEIGREYREHTICACLVPSFPGDPLITQNTSPGEPLVWPSRAAVIISFSVICLGFFSKNTVCSVIISVICFRSSKQPAWVDFGFGVGFFFFFKHEEIALLQPELAACHFFLIVCSPSSLHPSPTPVVSCVCLRITPLSVQHWCRSMEELGQGAVLSTTAPRHVSCAPSGSVGWDPQQAVHRVQS